MSVTKWFIKRGHVYNTTTTYDSGGFDLLKWLRQSLLSYLNVPYYDNCCDAAKTVFPTRYNSTTSKLEYFNGTTWVKPPSTALT